VARIDAHHLEWAGPVRLCYLGEVLHTRPDGFGGSRSLLQVGAELYGHGGVESDVEVLCLLLETLAAAGLARIHLDLGHVAIFRGLARQAGLDAASEQTLFDALQRKARPEIDAFLDRLAVGPEVHRMLAGLVDLNGGPEVLEEARSTLAGASEEVRAALAELESVFRQVHARVPEVPLYFDLAELRGYGFHTGVVFAAFVPGHGEEIARGGRYDAIGRFFGRARPATGFSTDLKTLVKLREEAAPAREAGGVLAPWSDDPALLARVRELRAAGTRVCWLLPGQEPPAGAWDRRLVERGGAWVIEAAGA
jgi:ATP phosphoribosyltransferase regulatory subunit